MDTRKCECGHTNPLGTLLCESCGKPTEEQQVVSQASFPDMRYEGRARRSQTYKRSVVDRIWNFFSSVKIAIYLIIITLLASAVGTIFPQKPYIPVPVPTEADVEQFYGQTYGVLGKIFYALGFHHLYDSWWFVTLLVMIGTSLVICSLDRIIPLYKALSKPRLNQHVSFLRGQRLYAETAEGEVFEANDAFERAGEVLKKRGYKIFRDGESLLAEKARFSRWGPYVNHIGLIIFLLGVLLRSVPGFYMDQFVWVREGQTVSVPGTPYYVKNERYRTDYYSEDEFAQKLDLKGGVIAKNYQTDAILYLNENADLPGADPSLKEILKGPIVVNHPMVYEGLSLFQTGRQEMQLGALNFSLVELGPENKTLGDIKLDLYAPDKDHKINDDITVRVLDYYPDFFMDGNAPATKTNVPNNPMFALEVISAKDKTTETMVYLSGTVLAKEANPRYSLAIKKPDLINISGLMVRKDKALPLIYFGCFVSIIGLTMGFYWQHRRIWLQLTNGRLHLAGHTNKNWFGLRKEAEDLVGKLQLPLVVTVRSQDRGGDH